MPNPVFSGLADYGRAKTYMNSGIVVIVAIVVVVVAVMMARNSAKDVHTLATRAALKNVKCETTKSQITDANGLAKTVETVTCWASADYSVNGTAYTAQGLTFHGPKSDGAWVEVYVNPRNPNDVISSKPMPPIWGYGIASGAVVLAVGSVGWAYLIGNSETLAAVHGAREAAGDVRSLFRGGLPSNVQHM